MSDAMDTKTAQEYWVSSDELLLAGARALDDGEQQRGIDLLSKAFEHRSFAAILFQKERDTLAAELARISSEMGLPPTIGPAPGSLAKLLADGQAAVAELAALRAGLPRWRDEGVWRFLRLGPLYLGTIKSVDDQHMTWTAMKTQCHDTREAAMLAVTEALGLPPCEVEGE